MKTFVILIIISIAVYYLILFAFIFGIRWKQLFQRKRKEVDLVQPDNPGNQEAWELVGKSKTVPIIWTGSTQSEKPFRSEDLQSEQVETEPDTLPEDVESNIIPQSSEEPLDEEEQFIRFENEDDIPLDEFSSGLTYEEIYNAAEVLAEKRTSSFDRRNAARTIYKMGQTEIYEFLVSEAGNEKLVKGLMEELLSQPEMELPESKVRKKVVKKDLNGFDIWDYV